MGATAIRLVVADVQPKQPVRILEEATRGVPLGRDAFSGGAIGSETIDAAHQGRSKDSAKCSTVMASRRFARSRRAPSARRATARCFSIASGAAPASPSKSSTRPKRAASSILRSASGWAPQPAFKSAWTLVAEVGGGSTSLTLLRRGRPNRSGVYAVGAIRMRQQLNLRRHAPEVQVSLLKRYIANVVGEIRVEIPLDRVTHFIAIGGDVRFAASQIKGGDNDETRSISREDFLMFCDQVEALDEEVLAERFRLPAVEAETLVPALLVYRALHCRDRMPSASPCPMPRCAPACCST